MKSSVLFQINQGVETTVTEKDMQFYSERHCIETVITM